MGDHGPADLLRDLALIMILGGVATIVFHRLRQPLILGYLLAGVAVSPFTPIPLFVRDPGAISLLADLGIILLMFGLGLEFSVTRLRAVGSVALIGGALQVLIVFAIGYQAGLLLGWSTVTALFLGAALSISSTAVIIKVLEEQRRLNEPASRAVIGILVFEDFAAIVMIAVLSGVGTSGTVPLDSIGPVLLKLAGFLSVTFLLGRSVIPWLINHIEAVGRREVLIVGSLALCFGMAMFSRSLGLSVAAGAFLAGTLVAESGKSHSITEAITPIRDMFAALFFVAIGMLFNPTYLGEYWVHILLLTGLLIAGKVFAGTAATFLLGHSHRSALQAGMSLAQIGEFSLIIVKVGQDSGAIAPFLYPVIVGVTVVSTLTTPYLIRLSGTISARLDASMPPRVARSLAAVELTLEQVRAAGAYRIGVREAVQKYFTGIVGGLLLFTVGVVAARLVYENRAAIARLLGVPDALVTVAVLVAVTLVAVATFTVIARQSRKLTSMVGSSSRPPGLDLLLRGGLPQVIGRNAITFVILLVMVVVLQLFVPAVPGMYFLPFLILALGAVIAGVLLWDSIRAVRKRVQRWPYTGREPQEEPEERGS
ncbi:MAG: hypothetical protein FJ314_01485 [SAR202 cluster bacterium]|nr:hypothetical protein [SAR202 cluster bacterium]